MGLSLEFRVCSISPIPLEGFSLNFGHMFAPVRWCAELITQTCRHKVKVTVQVHRFQPWISFLLCISYTSGRIFFKLLSNVRLSETMCRINLNHADSRSSSQFKVKSWSRKFCVRSVSPLPLGGFSLKFGQMFTLVGHCAEPITQPWGLKDKVKVASLSPEFRVHSIPPLLLEGFSFNFGQTFASVKWWAEPIAQPCRLTRSQFKVTGLSLEFCVRSVSPLPLGGFYLNFGQMFSGTNGRMCRTHNSALRT